MVRVIEWLGNKWRDERVKDEESGGLGFGDRIVVRVVYSDEFCVIWLEK